MNKDVRFSKFLRRIYQSNEYRLCGINKLLYNFVHCIGHNLSMISPHERVTRWRSWLRLQFPMVLLEFFIDILGVACWPLVPKFAGSNPAEAVGFLGRKILSTPSFGG